MAVNATAVWRVRAGGNNANGAGYDAAISGAGTDYSQQDTAQASGTHGTSSNTTTFVDATANAFTSAMVGNAIWIATGGGTVGAYFVTGYTSASTVTIDRAPGTVSAGSWKLGGAWADFWTNPVVTSTPVVGGNTIYINGSGTDTPTSADYTMPNGTTYLTSFMGSTSTGYVNFVGTNGRPRVSVGGMIYQVGYAQFRHMYFQVATNQTWYGSQGNAIFYCKDYDPLVLYDLVIDQNGVDACIVLGGAHIEKCEIFSSIAGTGTHVTYVNSRGSYEQGQMWHNCLIHDTVSGGFLLEAGFQQIVNCVIANCYGAGLTVNDSTSPNETRFLIANNTFSGNGGNGNIVLQSSAEVFSTAIVNNIIANHTGSGIYFTTGTTAQNNALAAIIEYNQFYGNGSNTNAYTLPSSNTTTNPNFANASNEDYTPASPSTAMPFPINRVSGKTSMTQHGVVGAVQPASSGGSTTYVINRTTNTFLTDGDSPYAA